MLEKFLRHIAQTSDAPMGLEVSHAEGPFIFTKKGKRFIDFISGIAVSSLGHRHPKVIKAIHEQVDKHLHVMVYGEFVQQPQVDFAELLISNLPKKLEQVYLVNSGTEATEGALKLAKKYTGRTKLIGFKNSYHGDTHGSLSVTGRDVYRDPYLPLLPNVYFLEFNSDKNLDLIDEETAAVIMEPIQGEGGIIPAQKEWLQKIRERCDEAGALLIFDEIQSGFGRTGKLFAFEHYKVVPDILCIAKAMGGGMPIGGFVSSTKIFQSFKYDPPLNHVTTFGGHPVSAAAAHANFKELLSGNYLSRAVEIEQTVKSKLKGKGILEVRGMGAMLGLQLESRELTKKVVEECFEKGILLGWTLHSNTLIRLAPPLTIENDLLNEVLDTILEAVERHS
ncbi:MAG TPA: aspartate aminotransferase family protein [Gracilimonas sp.]|uniref:aspartate aminotransferase family protein n=1 Tax=Gracilimonas sp. TaxID=1974203 RepID=UPI002D9F2699|nr:aspartate aminotransferase family protein [Gracilimonas sp.]